MASLCTLREWQMPRRYFVGYSCVDVRVPVPDRWDQAKDGVLGVVPLAVGGEAVVELVGQTGTVGAVLLVLYTCMYRQLEGTVDLILGALLWVKREATLVPTEQVCTSSMKGSFSTAQMYKDYERQLEYCTNVQAV